MFQLEKDKLHLDMCKNCPYIQEELDRRIDHIPEIRDCYGNMTYDEIIDEITQNCWCDKTGYKVWWYGQCGDAYSDTPNHQNRSKRKRRNKRERDLKYKNHLKHLAKTHHLAMPVGKDGYWNFDDPNETIYYKRLYRGNHRSNRYTYFKKYANRCVRRYKEKLSSGGSYKKVFDYWWNVN